MDEPLRPMNEAEWDRTVQEASRAAMKVWRGRHDEAEDFRNEVVVRLMGYREKQVTRAAVFGLALAIANNLQTDEGRKKSHQPRQWSLEKGPTPAASAFAYHPANEAEHAALLDALVQSLTTEERIIVRLCLVEGMTLRAAAEAVGVPESTLRRRLESAVKTMEQVGRAWYGDEPAV